MSFELDTQEGIEQAAEQLKAARKAQAQQQKQQTQAHQAAQNMSGLQAWLKTVDLYWIAKMKRYLWKSNGTWYFLSKDAMAETFPTPLNDKRIREQLPVAMESLGRVFADCTYTFQPQLYHDTLNMLDVSDWLQPASGTHHWIFDVLIQSLGSGKKENMEHIKHVLTYKYQHPDNWLIPAIVIYGTGRVGKGILVDHVLYAVFAGHTITAINKFLMGEFNAKLAGKACAAINETVVGKGDRGTLYDTLNKRRLIVNDKGEKHYEVDNTALYMIFSNDWNGGTLLDRGESDERLSILCCEPGKTLRYWIARHEGINDDEAQHWLDTEGKRLFDDKAEIAKWLGYLVANYGGREMPHALHGEDYKVVMGVQERVDEKLWNAVFTAEDFTYVSVVDLYQGYQVLSKQRAPNHRAMGMSSFNRHAEIWMQRNMPHIQKRAKVYNELQCGKNKQTKKTVWLNTKLENPLSEYNFKDCNRDKYIEGDSWPSWIGPEVV